MAARNATSAVKGQIIQPPGEQRDWLNLEVVKTKPGKVPDRYRPGFNQIRTHVESDGTYVVRDLEPGTYYMCVSSPGQTELATAFVEVVDRMVEQNFEIEAPSSDDYVIVWIYDPEGELVANADISAGVRSGGGSTRIATNPRKTPRRTLLTF